MFGEVSVDAVAPPNVGVVELDVGVGVTLPFPNAFTPSGVFGEKKGEEPDEPFTPKAAPNP